MKNIFDLFNSIPKPKLKRNKFNLNHDVKLTTEFGRITPMMTLYGVPGDTFKIGTEVACKMAPIISPIMDGIDILNFYFRVPFRLLMTDEDFTAFFIDGDPSVFPRISFTDEEAYQYLRPGTLLDYLGYPTIEVDETGSYTHPDFRGTKEFSALPILAYNLIYNEYFRDENLIEPIEVPKFSGVMTATELQDLLLLRNKAYRKDYFTSALPFTQKGPQVHIPFGGDVDISYEKPERTIDYTRMFNDRDQPYVGDALKTGPVVQYQHQSQYIKSQSEEYIDIDNSRSLHGTITSGTATINDLRYMSALQRYLERKAIGGSRPAEWGLAIFGVKPSDLRLHRPQFLGSTSTPIVISAVDQTSSTSEVSPQGYQAGKGGAFGSSKIGKVFIDEFSLVIGLSVVSPRNTYFQGCSRHLTKFDPYEYFLPQFQGIGEQAVLRQELYFDWRNNDNNEQTFGYQSRYSEYKFEPSRVHGDFKGSLNFYHLARFFGSSPSLNKEFIEINPKIGDLNRIFAVELPDTDPGRFEHFWIEFYHHVSAKRPMKLFGLPSLL